jgi:protein TonB
MKTNKIGEDQFNEIVFENRNKEYGAYALRTAYKKRMTIAVSISLTVLLLAVTFPLIAGYMNKTRYVKIGGDDITIFDVPPETDAPPPPPPPPPPPEVLEQKVRFTAPVVVSDSIDNNDALNQDIIGNNQNTPPPPEDTLVVIEKPDDIKIIEIKPPPFIVVEEMPNYPGGDEARIKFISENVVYPVIARESNTQGTVYVTFVVEADGSITEVKILRGIGSGCDEEAMRVVKMMPKWNAGRQSGKSVRVQFNLPIKFTLQ